MSKTRAEVIKNAKKYLGKPYVWGGESMTEGGFDCSGYVFAVMRDSGFNIGRNTAQGYYNHIGTITQSPGEGDLVFFGKSENKITHVAIYAGSGKMYESIGSSKNTKKNPGKGVSLSKVTRRSDLIAYKKICVDSAPSQTAPAHTSTTQQHVHKVGEVVTYSTCYNSSADPNSKAINCNPWRSGTITKIKTGAKNPYLIENGRCWINDGDIRSTGSVQQTSQTASAVYVVKNGDTLTKIAKAHGTTVNTIKKLNGIKDANKIVVGQKIRLK